MLGERQSDYRVGDPWRFALAVGGQRKETGSHCTAPELVLELIESALVPVMGARLERS